MPEGRDRRPSSPTRSTWCSVSIRPPSQARQTVVVGPGPQLGALAPNTVAMWDDGTTAISGPVMASGLHGHAPSRATVSVHLHQQRSTRPMGGSSTSVASARRGLAARTGHGLPSRPSHRPGRPLLV